MAGRLIRSLWRWAVRAPAFLLPLLLACGGPNPPAHAKPPAPEVPMPSVTDTSGLPAELLPETPVWETVQAATVRTPLTATRLYADGRVYAYGSTRRVLKDGLPRREPAPPGWRLDALVSTEGVALVRRIVGGSAFQALTSTGDPTTPDTSPMAVRAVTPAGRREFVLSGKVAREPPGPVREVQIAIQRNVVPGGVPMEQ